MLLSMTNAPNRTAWLAVATAVLAVAIVPASASSASQGGVPGRPMVARAGADAGKPVERLKKAKGKTRTGASQGNVTATLPPVVFGETDGLPAQLVPGQEYTAEVMIWVTPGAKKPRAYFSLPNGTKPSCKHTELAGGVVTRVRCTFVAGRNKGADSTLSATVKIAADYDHAYKDYPHTLAG